MAAAAGRALLRSVRRSKMGMTTAPHVPLLRDPLPLGLHGRRRGPGSCSSYFFSSTSAPNGSTRLPTNENLGQNKKSHSEWDRANSAFKDAKINVSFFMAIGTLIYLFGWARSTVKEARYRKRLYLEDRIIEAIKLEFPGIDIEDENESDSLSKAESTQSSAKGV